MWEIHPQEALPILQQMREVEESVRQKCVKLEGHLIWKVQDTAETCIQRIRDAGRGQCCFVRRVLHKSIKRHKRRSQKLVSKHNRVLQAIQKNTDMAADITNSMEVETDHFDNFVLLFEKMYLR